MATEKSLADFFQRVADAFLAGDHLWLAEAYVYPLAVYIEGEIVIERNQSDTLNSLQRRRELALSAGVASIKSYMIEMGKVRDSRVPVRVDWHFIDAKGATVAVNELRYFCIVEEPGLPRIEILEFLHRGLKDSRFAVH